MFDELSCPDNRHELRQTSSTLADAWTDVSLCMAVHSAVNTSGIISDKDGLFTSEETHWLCFCHLRFTVWFTSSSALCCLTQGDSQSLLRLWRLFFIFMTRALSFLRTFLSEAQMLRYASRCEFTSLLSLHSCLCHFVLCLGLVKCTAVILS